MLVYVTDNLDPRTSLAHPDIENPRPLLLWPMAQVEDCTYEIA